MAFPPGTPTVTLVGTISSAVAGAPFKGRLVCKPSAYLVDAGRNAVYPGGGSVSLDADGNFSVVLLPCDASGVEPAGWRWYLDLQPTGGTRIAFYANITGTGTVHFDDLVPVPAPNGGPAAGGAAVTSVNGETGAVVLSASDVGADPAGTASSAVSMHTAASDPHGDRAAAATALAAHEADTTAVHGISNTANLETQTGAQSKADAAQAAAISSAASDATAKVAAHAAASDPHGDRAAATAALAAHEADTTLVHGIADTAALETQSGAQAKATTAQTAATTAAASALTAHEADTTNIHGIADTAVLETATGAQTKVNTHRDAADPHGDRAWAASQFYPQASGSALDVYVNDALTRLAAIEGGTAFLAGLNSTGTARVINTELRVEGSGGTIRHRLDGAGNKVGFYGATPVAQQTVTGTRNDGTAYANLVSALVNLGLIADGTTTGITAQWRRRHLPDPVVVDSLYTGTAPSISTAQTTTPTAGYIKYAPAGVALSGSDVTGPFTYAGAGNFQIGTIAPDTSYVLPLSKYPNTYASGQGVYSVEFGTDAQIFQVRMKYISTATMYRLSIDGRKVTDLMQASNGTTAGSGHLITFDLGSAAPRRIRLDFSTFPFGGVYIPPTATLWGVPLQGGRLMTFTDSLGDGSAQNTGAGCGTWVDRVARFLGSTDVWRQGRGGTGYITAGSYATFGNRVSADVVGWSPDRLIVWGGYNDNGGSQSAIGSAAASLYSTIRSGLPACDVYVIGCWSPTGSPAASITNTDATLRTAAAAAGYPFISPLTGGCYHASGALVATHGAFITSANAAGYIGADAVHPNDAGHVYLARRITAAIRELMPA